MNIKEMIVNGMMFYLIFISTPFIVLAIVLLNFLDKITFRGGAKK